MAKIRKINVSETRGNSSALPAGNLVVYEQGSNYVLRAHDGITEGGKPICLDVGQLKVYDNTIGTSTSDGEWGGYNLTLAPNGEGDAWLFLPNDANSATGSATTLGNGEQLSGGVNIVSYNNTWNFNTNGKLAGPISYENTNDNLELESNLVMNRSRGFVGELGMFPHAIEGDDWWFDVVVNKDGYVYAIGGSDINNEPIIVKFNSYGNIIWQRRYATTLSGVEQLNPTSADWNADGNLVVYGQGFDVTNDNQYVARFTVDPNNGNVTTPVGEIIRATDEVSQIPNVYAEQMRYNAAKTDYAMVGSKYGGDSLPLTISTSSAVSTTPGILKIPKTSIIAAFGAAEPQTYNQAWGITGYGLTGIINFTGVTQETTDTIEYYLLETDTSVDFSALPEGQSWAIRFYDWADALIITDNWAKSFDTGNEEDHFTSVVFDSNGNIYAGGETRQLTASGGYTSLLVSTTSTGTVRWAKRIEDEEGAGVNRIQGLTVDSSNYIYTISSEGDGQTVIAKISSDGTVQWIKTMSLDSGMSSHYNSKIQYCSVDDTIVFAIEYSSIASYNDDFLLVKMNLDGSVEWANSFGSSSEENVNWNESQDFLSVDDDYIYVCGSRYTSGFDDNAMLFSFPHDGVASGWVGPYNVRNAIDSLSFATGNTANLSVTTLTSADATTNLSFTSNYTVQASDSFYEYRKMHLNGGYNKIKNVSEIVFADGSSQATSASDVPQASIMDNSSHTINSGDRGKHILLNVYNNSSSIYVPCHGDDPLPIGSVITLVLNEPADDNGVYIIGSDNGGETVYIRAIGSDSYTNSYWFIGGDNVQGLYTLMKIDNNVWILSGSTIEISGP